MKRNDKAWFLTFIGGAFTTGAWWLQIIGLSMALAGAYLLGWFSSEEARR